MKKTSLLSLLLLLIVLLSHVHAQNVNLIVTHLTGEEQTFPLSEESQLYFDNGENLVIEDGTGTTMTFPLSDIRKIVCTEITDIKENTTSELQILPNPSHNCFIIKNLQENCQGRIYTLDGRQVKSFEASEGTMVDISELSDGMYLLHIHGQTLKLMKL